MVFLYVCVIIFSLKYMFVHCNNKKIYLVDLKPNKNINEFCRNKGVNLQEINCSKCEHYRSRAKTLSKICETCTTMPMDNFIQNVIAPKVI